MAWLLTMYERIPEASAIRISYQLCRLLGFSIKGSRIRAARTISCIYQLGAMESVDHVLLYGSVPEPTTTTNQ